MPSPRRTSQMQQEFISSSLSDIWLHLDLRSHPGSQSLRTPPWSNWKSLVWTGIDIWSFMGGLLRRLLQLLEDLAWHHPSSTWIWMPMEGYESELAWMLRSPWHTFSKYIYDNVTCMYLRCSSIFGYTTLFFSKMDWCWNFEAPSWSQIIGTVGFYDKRYCWAASPPGLQTKICPIPFRKCSHRSQAFPPANH